MARSNFLLTLFVFICSGVRAQFPCTPQAVLNPLDTWQTVSGSYGANEWAIYEVTMDLDVDYIFKTGCGDGATADHNTVIEWMTPGCTVILSNDDGCDSARSELSFNSFFSDGTALWIRVRGAQGAGGSFTLAYRSIGGPPGQCNTCPSYDAQLFPSSLWQLTDSAYGANGCKVYRIFATAGMEYTFKTGCGDGASSDHDTRLELFGAGCIALSTDDNTCESGRSLVTWTALNNGALYVKVSGVGGSAGAFTMAYRRSGGNGSACGTCPGQDFSITPGANWATSASSYLAGGCQIYRVSVTDGYHYTFKTGCGNGGTADHDTFLELMDEVCDPLMTDDDGCESGRSIIGHTATSTGFVYLKVRGASGQEGFYTLAHRRSGTCITCPAFDSEVTPDSSWQTSSGSYFNDGCWLYKVNVEEGHTYVFQTEFGNGASADHWTQLELFDDSCGAITPGSWEESGARLYHLASFTGHLYLKVSGVGGDFGSHTMAYRDVGGVRDHCADVVPIEFGYGSIELAGTLLGATSDDDFVSTSPLAGLPMKWYAFDIQVPCSFLIVSYCGTLPPWSNTLDVLATDCPGDEVLTSYVPFPLCSDGNADHSFYPSAPGLYYLPLLYDTLNSVDGEYVISVTCSSMIIDAIEEEAVAPWSVFPNPGSDEIMMEHRGGVERRAEVGIRDLLGRPVWQGVIATARSSVRTAAWPPGTYLIEILDGMGRTAIKWIKN